MLSVRLPTNGLKVTTDGFGTTVAYAFQEQDMKTLGYLDDFG